MWEPQKEPKDPEWVLEKAADLDINGHWCEN